MLAQLDAAALGTRLAPRPTPLKMLPVHNPPPVVQYRASLVEMGLDGGRNLMDDKWLHDTTDDCPLGRVIRVHPLDNNRSEITTNKGRIIATASMTVIRGRSNKRSIYGHTLEIREA